MDDGVGLSRRVSFQAFASTLRVRQPHRHDQNRGLRDLDRGSLKRRSVIFWEFVPAQA